MPPSTTPRPFARTKRRFGALVGVLAIVASALVPSAALGAAPNSSASTVVSTNAAQTRSAGTITPMANLANFRPGNIISDAVFFNSASMTQGQVDSFLQSKGGTCRSGYTCLKDYRQSTPDRAADTYCDGYRGAANESAATIIYKAAVSCGINPQVLIVMLEKEQSLVTHTWPSQWRYDMALGQGCPDTAPCDPAFSGFFYQIYGAARQMQIYAEGRWFTWYAPGKTWNILYNPNHACGSSPVYIENKATAALYYYTPYQPNAAALRAGYGTGDSCSAYGNRNFFNFFEDWFGSTQAGSSTISAAIESYWTGQGGASGWIGAATDSGKKWADGGTSQRFTGADLYARADGKVFPTVGAIRTEYRLVGEASSGLGWPTSPRYALSGGGAYQDFDNGRIYERPDGKAYAIAAPMYAVHESLQNVFGRFGWPTDRAVAITGGAKQTFDGGTIYESSAGTFALSLDWDKWYIANNKNNALGMPVTGEVSAGGGFVRVAFAKGAVFRSSSSVLSVKAPFLSSYKADRYELGALGRPTANPKTVGTANVQEFTGGQIHSSAAGVFAVTKLAAALAAKGGTAKMGVATANQVETATAASQKFTNATLTTGAGGAQIVVGAIKSAYDAAGGAASFLGAAKGAEKAVAGGYVQDFDGGRIVVTSRLALTLDKPIVDAWDNLGGPTGRMGMPIVPIASFSDGTRVLEFAGGVMMSHKTHGTHSIFGVTLRTYRIAGGTPVVGAPTAAEQKIPQGFMQTFSGGIVFVPLKYPASAVVGKEFAEYTKGGGLAGFGVPTGPATPIGIGKVQPFETGSISVSSTGTWAVRGTMRMIHNGSGAYTGPLGYPTESERKVLDGYVQNFQGGTAYVSPVALAVTRGVLHREYAKTGGPGGSLGWPLANETSGDGWFKQEFQNGSITLYADGRVIVKSN